jgi:hypothetical protein
MTSAFKDVNVKPYPLITKCIARSRSHTPSPAAISAPMQYNEGRRRLCLQGDETPPERQVTEPYSPQLCGYAIDHLHELLARLGPDDLEALKKARDALIARCKEIEMGILVQPEAEMSPMLVAEPDGELSPLRLDRHAVNWNVQDKVLADVAFADDGGRVPLGAAGLGEWEISREIGAGCYGKVFSAKNKGKGRAEAVKVIVKDEVSFEDWPSVVNEHLALRTLGEHPCIAWLTGALQSQTRVYFFMVFAKGKDLFDFCKLRQQNSAGVPKPAVAKIFSSIAGALSHCHNCSICHLDVKPENITVNQDYSAKLVDFGCARHRYSPHGKNLGTLPFIAPEILHGTATDGAPADVWSLGVVLLEMLHGLRTLSKTLGWEMKQKSSEERASDLSAWCADPVEGLACARSSRGVKISLPCDETLVSMLHVDPAQRPSTDVLCGSSWLSQFSSGK